MQGCRAMRTDRRLRTSEAGLCLAAARRARRASARLGPGAAFAGVGIERVGSRRLLLPPALPWSVVFCGKCDTRIVWDSNGGWLVGGLGRCRVALRLACSRVWARSALRRCRGSGRRPYLQEPRATEPLPARRTYCSGPLCPEPVQVRQRCRVAMRALVMLRRMGWCLPG